MESSIPSLRPSTLIKWLFAIEVFLVLACLGGQFSKYFLDHGNLWGCVDMFNLDLEFNIPTFFSMILLLTGALLLGVITYLQIRRKGSHVLQWATLTLGYLFMAYDEIYTVHERLVDPMRSVLGDEDLGIFYFAWVIPGIAVVILLGLYFLRFLRDLPAQTRNRFLFAGFLYVGGSCGVELAGGYYAELHGTENWNYNLLATLEESMEMGGQIIFIWALMRYLGDNYGELRLRFAA